MGTMFPLPAARKEHALNIIDPYMRSSIYKELSELYQYPEPDRFQRLQSENRILAGLLEAYAADTGLSEEQNIFRLCHAIRTAKTQAPAG